MATPFVDLPSGCPSPGFSPAGFVPAGFTLCSVPGLPLPTLAPTPFQIQIVDNVPPPYCPCIPTMSIDKYFDIDLQDSKIHMQFTQKSATVDPDCCDPKLLWTMDLKIPCMPLAVTQSSGHMVIRTGDTHALSHIIKLSKVPGTCALDLKYDIKIPCMPLDVTAKLTVKVTQGNKATGNVSVRKTGTCNLDFNFDLKIPCMPLAVTQSTKAMVIRPSAALSHVIKLTKVSGTCALDLKYDIKIPCMPLTVTQSSGAIVIRPSGTKVVSHNIRLTKVSGTCALDLKYDIKIPCLPLSMTAKVTARNVNTVGFTAIATAYKQTGTCCYAVDFDLQVPLMPFDLTNSIHTIHIGMPGSPPTADIHLSKRYNSGGGGALDLHYDIECPCTPLQVTANATAYIWPPSPIPLLLSYRQPTFHVSARMSGTCKLIMDYTLVIPCMPLDVTANATAAILPVSYRWSNVPPYYFRTNVRPTFAVTARMTINDTCKLVMDYDIRIPCMPLDVTALATVAMTWGNSYAYGVLNPPTFAVTARMTGTCRLAMDFDLQIPCMPFAVHNTGTFRWGYSTSVLNCTLALNQILGTCALELNYDIAIPCTPIRVYPTATVHYTYSGIYPHVTLKAYMGGSAGTPCLMRISYDLALPCMPFYFTARQMPAIGTGAYVLNVSAYLAAVPGTCKIELQLILYRGP